MTNKLDDKPEPVLHLEEQCKTQIGVNEGTVSPECFYCKKNPCYALSMQGKFFVRTLLYDETHLVCGQCWTFMNKSGKWLTKIIRWCLRINVFLRKVKNELF